jgi:hypothetical protein
LQAKTAKSASAVIGDAGQLAERCVAAGSIDPEAAMAIWNPFATSSRQAPLPAFPRPVHAMRR